jgi:hypothetical protein
MSNDTPGPLGRLDDEEEAAAEAQTGGGAAAAGDYDPAQGSPGTAHPTGEPFPEEAVRYDDPEQRPRTESGSDESVESGE